MSEEKENTDTTASTEQHFSLLAQAQDEFNRKLYSQCLQTLAEIEKSFGNKEKIAHNVAVVEFYNGNEKGYKDLFKFLDSYIIQTKQKEETEKITSNRRLPTVLYNKAVILFHLRKPFTSLEMLNPVGGELEHLDETLLPRIGLLMLHLLILTNQFKKAFNYLKYFRNVLGIEENPLVLEENLIPESINKIEGFKKYFKYLSVLTYIINKKNIILSDDEVDLAILKGHQFYIGKDFQMAAKQLLKNFMTEPFTVEQNGDDQETCVANNMGIIHLRVRHYAIATRFFQHAILFDNKFTENMSGKPLHYVGASKKPEILYNLGIALLYLEKPREAFDCFLIALKMYHKNPRLWLRIAEACIMHHEQNSSTDEKKVITPVGSGLHKKFLLKPYPKIKISSDEQSFAIPSLNLEFASLCLRNAVSLIENCKKKFYQNLIVDEDENEDWKTTQDRNFCNPSSPVSKEVFNNLVAAIYAAYSYVCIRLGDFVIGLEYGKMLLLLENISDAYTVLGHLYSAEALIMLNRTNEARAYLEPTFITNMNALDFETKNWKVNSIEAAQSIMRYNLVVTLLLQGEFDLARALLSTCSHPLIATRTKMLKLYIEIASGNMDNCKINSFKI